MWAGAVVHSGACYVINVSALSTVLVQPKQYVKRRH